MKRLSPPLVLASALAACTASQSPPAADAPAIRPSSTSTGQGADAERRSARAPTRLTVYSGDYDRLADWRGDGAQAPGYALVDTRLRYALKAGDNLIRRNGLPASIDVAAVSLRPTDAAIVVNGQRYQAPPDGAHALLAQALGQRVAVEHTSGGAKQSDNGVLVAADDGLVLALPDGRTKVIRQYDNFSLLDSARQPMATAALRWQVQAPRAGEADFSLSYPTGGLAWRAEYRTVLGSGAGCALSLAGAALVANRSGADFDGVSLTLVAGEPRRVRAGAPQVYEAESTMVARAAPAPSVPQDQPSGEYHAYPIPAKATLADGSIERVALFPAQAGIACKRAYETAPPLQPWQPPQPLTAPGANDSTGPQPVTATVAFDNSRKAGLGRPLPAGRVRLFDGEDFLGESELAHTPEGASLHLEVGTAFDLTADRERTAFHVDRAGRTMTESFAITLRNAKDEDATVTVVEPLPRWSDWTIADSSVPAVRRDAQHAQFEVPVPAGGETRLTYTARYRWAPDRATDR